MKIYHFEEFLLFKNVRQFFQKNLEEMIELIRGGIDLFDSSWIWDHSVSGDAFIFDFEINILSSPLENMKHTYINLLKENFW